MPEIMVRFDDLRRYCEKRHCGSVPLEYIKQMPAIEAETVRHGRWLPCLMSKFRYECSCCGEPSNYPPPYCPNCGTYMREGGADNANQ